MEYYYTDAENINLNEKSILIKGFEYKHLVKVLRINVGDTLNVTDGKRNIYNCLVVNITKDSVLCNIKESKYNLFEPEVKIHLFVSPLRNQNRLEFLIEKCVELGVFEIHPVISRFTIKKNKFSENKLERLRKIALSAMGQSQRCYLPVVNNTVDFNELLRLTEGFDSKFVYYEYAENNKENSEKSINSNELCILIGPEGGFDKTEIDLLINNNWQVKSLGDRKLRAETAAIISIFENINKHI